MFSNYKCGKCGVVTDNKNHLCKPEPMENKSEFCGSGRGQGQPDLRIDGPASEFPMLYLRTPGGQTGTGLQAGFHSIRNTKKVAVRLDAPDGPLPIETNQAKS